MRIKNFIKSIITKEVAAFKILKSGFYVRVATVIIHSNNLKHTPTVPAIFVHYG
jgi:hypothetical protein